MRSAAAFLVTTFAGEVHQNLTHQFRGDCEEVGAVAPLDLIHIYQPQIGFVYQRQGLQLKLQSTVEGLSVAAISYYIIGLLHYVALGLEARGWVSHPDFVTALAVPLVVGLVWWFMQRLHHKVFTP